MPNWLGDFLMATPILTDLREALPDSKITVMVKRNFASLLSADSRIDELFLFEKPHSFFARREEDRNIRKKIELGQYDAGLLLTNSFSSAWWFYQGKIPMRIGYADHFRKILLTHPMEKEDLHQYRQYKRLLAPLGIEESTTLPSIVLPPKEIIKGKKWLSSLGVEEKGTIIGIAPSSAYGPAKCWPEENFRALTKRLLEDETLYLLFFGTASDSPLIERITHQLGNRAINLAGRTTLVELSAMIFLSHILITNDSGPMHIASALQKPTLALFGSTNPDKTGPVNSHAVVLKKELSCSPCYLRKCPIDFPCMKGITVQEVLEEIEKMRVKEYVSITSP